MLDVVQVFTRDQFYVAKGLIALLGVILLVIHMTLSVSLMRGWGQPLRYLTLAAFAGNVAFASIDQRLSDLKIRGPYLTALICVVLLVITMIVSIIEDHPRLKAKRENG